MECLIPLVFAVCMLLWLLFPDKSSPDCHGDKSVWSGETMLRDKDGNLTNAGVAYIDGLDGEFDLKITPDDWFKF